MKKIMFGNSIMLLGLAIMMAGNLMGLLGGYFYISVAVLLIGFVMAVDGFACGDAAKRPDKKEEE